MYENIARVQSQKRIQDGNLAGLDHQGIFDLYMMAYGDEELASQARTMFLDATIKAECDAEFEKSTA